MDSRPDRFFLIVSFVFLVLVVLGFSPTFFVRGLMDVGDLPNLDLPAHVIAHGLFMTAWFVILVTQTLLVARGETARHRSLGVVGIVVAVGVVVTGVAVAALFPARAPAGNFAPEETTFIAVANSFILPAFVIFVVCAVYFRHQPEVHKRCMLVASLGMMAPTVTNSRLFGAVVQPIVPIDLFMLLAILVLVALIVHDVRRRQKVLIPTYYGVAAIIAVFLGIGAVVGSGLGAQYHDWLAAL